MREPVECTMLAPEVRSWEPVQFYKHLLKLDKINRPSGPSRKPFFVLYHRIRDYLYNRISREIFYNDMMDVLKSIPAGKKVSIEALMRMMPGPRSSEAPQTRIAKRRADPNEKVRLSKEQKGIATWISGKFAKVVTPVV